MNQYLQQEVLSGFQIKPHHSL